MFVHVLRGAPISTTSLFLVPCPVPCLATVPGHLLCQSRYSHYCHPRTEYNNFSTPNTNCTPPKYQTLVRTLVFTTAALVFIASYFFLQANFTNLHQQLIQLPSHSDPTSYFTHQFSTNGESSYRQQLLYDEHGVALSEQFPPYSEINPTSEANICFFLQISESSALLAPRLVDRIWHPQNIILIHVDAKVSHSQLNQLRNQLRLHERPNIHFTPRQSITYAGMSMLLNILDAMEFALTVQNEWHYFIYLSGSDYPLITPKNLRILLGQPRVLQQQVSFVQLCCGEKFWNNLKTQRFDRIYVDPALGIAPFTPDNSVSLTSGGAQTQVHTLLQTHKRNPMSYALKSKFLHSSAFITAHRTMVVQAARGAYERRLLALLSHMKDPEEHFFAMLAWNSNLNRTMAHRAGRLVFWELNGVKSGQHPYFVDQPSNQLTFWPVIAKSKALFVRKFKHPNSPLMDKIDSQISGAVQDDANTKQTQRLRRKLKEQTKFVMCAADIQRHWNTGVRSFYDCA